MKNPINELGIINRKTKKPLENISDFSMKDKRLYFKNEERDNWEAKKNFEESYFPFLDLYVIKNNGDIHPVVALADNGIAIRYGSMPIFHKDLDDFKELLTVNKFEKYPFFNDFVNMGIIESLYKDKISNLKFKRGMNPIKRDFERIYNKTYFKEENASNEEHLCSVVRMITYYSNVNMPKNTRTSVLRLLHSFKFDLLSFDLRRKVNKIMEG